LQSADSFSRTFLAVCNADRINIILGGLMYRIVLLFLFACSLLEAQQLPVPKEFSSQATYYYRTKQLDNFSCGYNALFNALNFGQCCGFTTQYHRYEYFEPMVLSYTREQGLNPKHTSYNKDTEHLAQDLGLEYFYHLHRDSKTRQVALLFTGRVSITYPKYTPQSEVDRRMADAVAQKRKGILEGITAYLRSVDTAVVHFLCYLKSARGESHAILISLHQNKTGRGLYIFDNLNEPIYEATLFIEYLSKTFMISSSKQFHGPQLPYRWPYLDRRDALAG